MSHKSYDKKYGANLGDMPKNIDIKKDDDFDCDKLSAKRFFVKDAHIGKCLIDGDEHNHLANVMRLKAGEEIILICDDEFDYFAKIVEIKKNQTLVDVYKKVENIANPKVHITAFVAMNKREQTSLMVRMLSELGVSTYVPIITKWTLGQDITDKMDRYQKIADQSVKQCRRSKTMKIEKPQKLDEVLKTFDEYDKVFFAYENEATKKLDENLLALDIKKTQQKNGQTKTSIAFIIGPVAGFDKDEAQKIEQSGAVSVSLGKRILRADTATIMLASILSNYYLD